MTLNETHDVRLRSWLASAHLADSDFPIQNLPFGIFRRAGRGEAFRGGIAIGDQVIDIAAALDGDVFRDASAVAAAELLRQPTLNQFMAAGSDTASALRLALSRALRSESQQEKALRACLVPQTVVELALPARIGDYTDFYTSIHHATAVGRMFRPDNPLLPNYKWIPIGYHGRSSSIVISGQAFKRPIGQLAASGGGNPTLGPSKRLDYELELGVWIGPGNDLGSQVVIGAAESHIFGMCLLNDWSARDLQAWEYQPLGPFLAKNFATSISPWIVTLEALEPFRVAWERAAPEPQPLSYLDSPNTRSRGAIDISLEVYLLTDSMRAAALEPQRLSQSNFKHAYWTIAQMVAHHTVNGCNLTPGDLLGTGTQSGPSAHEAGSLLELSAGGKQPIQLANGETRRFLEDGDTLILRGFCERPGAARLGFGSVSGRVLAADT